MEETTFTIIYPITISLTRHEGENDDDFRERAFYAADKIFESSPPTPLVHECSDPDLID